MILCVLIAFVAITRLGNIKCELVIYAKPYRMCVDENLLQQTFPRSKMQCANAAFHIHDVRVYLYASAMHITTHICGSNEEKNLLGI